MRIVLVVFTIGVGFTITSVAWGYCFNTFVLWTQSGSALLFSLWHPSLPERLLVEWITYLQRLGG